MYEASSCTKLSWNKKQRTIDCLSVYGGGSGISVIIQLLITHHFLPKIIDCLNFLLLFY